MTVLTSPLVTVMRVVTGVGVQPFVGDEGGDVEGSSVVGAVEADCADAGDEPLPEEGVDVVGFVEPLFVCSRNPSALDLNNSLLDCSKP